MKAIKVQETDEFKKSNFTNNIVMKKVYIKPSISIIKTDMSHLMAASGNILHDANTQKDHPGPEFGGDEPSDGGDLDAAKRSGFNFSESDTNIFK